MHMAFDSCWRNSGAVYPLKIFLPYFLADLIYFLRWKRLKAMVKKRGKQRNSLHSVMQTVGKIPYKPFLIYRGKMHTYQNVNRRSNTVAQVFLHCGNLKKGNTVALLMDNGPDFIHVWFGLAKLGCVVAFLTFNIPSRSLLHCINTYSAKALVIGEGKSGLLAVQVTQDAPFSGYMGNKASEKKFLHNMFVKEDVYFNTGDLLVMDEDVFLYFSDHVADTFGYCTELPVNPVSLKEITYMQDWITHVRLETDYEGRTGMAAVVVKPDQPFNGERLYKYVVDFLPTYAQRCFVRIMDLMQINATFKHQKMQLLNEGINPGIISEPLYFMHEPAHSYIPLTRDLYKNVTSGEINI